MQTTRFFAPCTIDFLQLIRDFMAISGAKCQAVLALLVILDYNLSTFETRAGEITVLDCHKELQPFFANILMSKTFEAFHRFVYFISSNHSMFFSQGLRQPVLC
jgi:hypothetical protein